MGRYSGRTKIMVCRRLHSDWQDIADLCDIPLSVRARFDQGREAHGIWEYLERRELLSSLEGALRDLGLTEVVDLMAFDPARPTASLTDGHPGRGIDVLSTVTFDLTGIKLAIEAHLDQVSRGIVAFSVPYGDSVFITHICDYLSTVVDPVACKPPFSLAADISLPADVIRAIAAYRDEELLAVDVVVPIRAEGVAKAVLLDFLADLSVAVGTPPRRLVLLFSTSTGADPVPDACQLPAPLVTRQDLTMWLRDRTDILRAHANRKLPVKLINRWADTIVERAQTPRGLNLRSVYDELQRTLTRFRDDPDGFYRFLSEGK